MPDIHASCVCCLGSQTLNPYDDEDDDSRSNPYWCIYGYMLDTFIYKCVRVQPKKPKQAQKMYEKYKEEKSEKNE